MDQMMNTPNSPKTLARVILLLAACCLATCPCTSIAADALAWNFEVGNEYNYQMVQDMEMTMDLGPTGSTTTGMKQTMDMKWVVEAIDENGLATVTQHIHRMQMVVSAPGQDTIRYDTASDDTPQGFAAMMAPMLTALTSEKFTVTMMPSEARRAAACG